MQPVQVPSVAISNLPDELPNPDVVLLDVREDDEWQAGHAPDALHIPLGELGARLGELPTDHDVFVVCRSGGRSARATAYLNQNGWDAVNVDGGMKAWAAAGRSVVSESGNDAEIL
ncbi:rhodanese-related sulfurtransferase [Actinoalloteichus hoggarensis]|uniref:rhodanese-like domain-containing protein n=1 Tax=Actinoalloteichus hoggarensis TaxID=1470176 RepID=UPI0018541EBC|nr:rhodanese-like domain-containing protein [Actinoalloteichus hoggarensis]MBB5922877.1 rhodanese-related sulfurtransferase [Actinoalloteichus hoggarensis]